LRLEVVRDLFPHLRPLTGAVARDSLEAGKHTSGEVASQARDDQVFLADFNPDAVF
jgi:hypothetical protein